MTAYVPPLAPLVVLAFLATAFLLAVGAAVLLYATLARKQGLAIGTVTGAGVLALVYGAALFTASAMSQERVLAHGELKYFCEIDCHLAYSVVKVETTEEIGNPPRPLHASGLFHVVALRAWFDPATISSRRPLDVPLTPNPRVVYVQDAAGRQYRPSIAAEEALVAMGRTSAPLTRPLKPGESYIHYLVFDLPKDVRNPRLFLGNGVDVEFLLIGHEMSPGHKRVWFSLL